MSRKTDGLSGRTLIYFSPIEWTGLHQRPHHLARVMASSFEKVIFVQPAGLRPIQFIDWRRVLAWIRLSAEGRETVAFNHIPENVQICTPSFIPLTGKRWVDNLNGFLVLKKLRSLLDDSILSKSILWTSTPAPLLQFLLPKLPGQYVVYDCIDDYRLFEHLPNAVSHTQKWLLEKADFVFASSRRLYEKAYGLRPANTVGMLSNGVDVDHWCSGDTRSELPPAIANMQHPIIGYFGTISHWLDTELIESMARRHPSWHFLFMGPAYRSKKLKRILHLSNIHWIGEQPYELLPSLASCFDVAWLPFRLTPMTKTINPVKVYEYLALGKRVVSPSLPDLERLGPYVILADDLQETESALVSAIESRLRKEDEAGCRAIAAEFSWDKLWNEAFTDLSAYLRSEMEVPLSFKLSC